MTFKSYKYFHGPRDRKEPQHSLPQFLSAFTRRVVHHDLSCQRDCRPVCCFSHLGSLRITLTEHISSVRLTANYCGYAVTSENNPYMNCVVTHQSLVSVSCYTALAAFEYFAQLPREVELFWKRKITGASVLFLSNRYLMLLCQGFDFANSTSVQVCCSDTNRQQTLALSVY